MGQIYISPVPGAFRLSMSVLTLSILLIHFPQAPVILVSCIIAVMTPFFRAFVDYITYPDVTFYQSFYYYYPVAIYYILYGIIFKLLKIRNKLDNLLLLIISLWFCDSTPNIAEALYRRLFTSFDFARVLLNIILMGLVRSILTYLVYWVSIYYKGRYDRKQKESKYTSLFDLSEVRAEIDFERGKSNYGGKINVKKFIEGKLILMMDNT